MTEKRFENRLDKNNIKFNTLNPVWDNKKEDALNVFEMIDLLNSLNKENKQLKQHQKNTTKEFQTLLKFIRSKGLTLTEYEKFKGDDGND